MKKNSKNTGIKKYLSIIKQIEKVRSKNNKNWMDLYRLAFAVAPNESVKIIKKILSRDKTVSKLAEKLIKWDKIVWKKNWPFYKRSRYN